MEEDRRFNYDGTGFLLEDKGFFPYSGEMHHFRVHPGLWKDRFLRMKRAFLNCTGAYFYWPIIEPMEGKFEFVADSDLSRYYQSASDAGLFTIARPGPYICAEVNAGGHPHWLFPNVKFPRSLDPAYIDYSTKYYGRVNEILHDFDIENGTAGKINLMYQVENEMFSRHTKGGNPEYHLKLRETAKSQYGNTVPFVTNENMVSRGTKVYDTLDIYPDPWKTRGIVQKVRKMLSDQPDFPCFGMEIEGGWFSVFGKGDENQGYSYRGYMSADWTEFFVKLLIGAGMSGINYYMFHGGTNFGWRGGKYITTTYDYQAPIAEWGGLTDRYFSAKIIGGFLNSFGSLLSQMHPDDEFFLKNYLKIKENNQGTSHPKIYCLTRAKKRSAFIFLYNESKVDKQFQLVFQDPTPEEAQKGPLEKVGIPAKSARIIPYEIPISNKITIRFATLEPYLCCKIKHRTILLFHGEVGEMFNAELLIEEKSQQISGIVQSDEDLYWNVAEELIVGVIETQRAKHTWVVEKGKSMYPVVSNQYLLYSYEFFNANSDDSSPPDSLHMQFHECLGNEKIRVTLPWFDPVENLTIDGEHVRLLYDAEKGVTSLVVDPDQIGKDEFDISSELVQQAKIVPLGERSWKFRKEGFDFSVSGVNSNWKEWQFNKSAEDLGLFTSGFTVYRSKFHIPPEKVSCVEKGNPIWLHIPAVVDNAIVLINNKFAGYVEQNGTLNITELIEYDFLKEKQSCEEGQPQSIVIVVERMGYYNHGKEETSGLLCGPYLAFDSEPVADIVGTQSKKMDFLPLTKWKLKANPELSVTEISESLSEIQPQFSFSSEKKDSYVWDDIEMSQEGHKGFGIVPRPLCAVYRTKFELPANWTQKELCLEFDRVVGKAWFFLNGNLLSKFSLVHEKSRTDLVEHFGLHLPREHLHYGPNSENVIAIVSWIRSSGQGLHGDVILRAFDKKAGRGWQVRDKLDGEILEFPTAKFEDLGDNGDWEKSFSISDIPSSISSMIWLKTDLTHYDIDTLWAPKYVELKGFSGKAVLWWNGQMIGRYWDIGPQTKFYVPEPLLKNHNEITLLLIPLGDTVELIKPPLLKAYKICRKREWVIVKEKNK